MDLTITVPSLMTVLESHGVEMRVREAVLEKRREVREVKIHVHAQERGMDLMKEVEEEGGGPKSDFGGRC